ncbi:uncharacterized protein LOC124817633 [Hydra vulgaris]|uniref:uncharacterized protein LOC124817633 n=1 Tax=Hydra vulgaris TaxID=6087 RepID=UPI001F5EFFFD|nr:uncharacterized protein LOC124817633 [Hydra vulgaris]
MSKARVSPLQSISIPRLELLGAVLGLRLAEKIVKALKLETKDVTIWCDRLKVLWWIKNQSRKLKPFVANYFRKKGDIAADEYHESEKEIIAKAQKESFKEEYSTIKKGKPISISSKIISLNPQIDKDGLLRSCSRLQNAHYLPYDLKYPIILLRGHTITKLIVKHYHDEANHVMGTNQLLTKLSEQYLVIRGGEEIRDAEAKCNKCKLKRCKPAQQLMAPLPAMRFKEPLRAFARIGINFAGPFLTMQGRGKIRQKRYLCLFTCLLSRAVHLEMAYNLDTNSFLNAFYRMVKTVNVQ